MADKNITTVNEISSVDDSDKVFVNDGNTLKQITVTNLMKKAPASSGGGTTDYNDLTNQPQLNGVTLEGNKTLDDIGAQPKGNYLTDVPQASSTIIGGIKAESAGAEDTVPVKIKSDGTLAVPTYPEGGSGTGGITVSYDADQKAIIFTGSSGGGN